MAEPTSKEAAKWFKGLFTQAKQSVAPRLLMGNMYTFRYDPKLKRTLPVYDTMPLIIPVEFYPDGVLGVNLHYLPIKTRIVFLRNIMITNYKRLQQGKPAIIGYKHMKNANVFRYGIVCLRRYLTSHMKTKAIRIAVEDWPKAAILQSHNFVKMSQTEVWKRSLMALKKRK